MNLNQLRIFFESAKSLNFSKAAENLYISQPAVSSQIKQMEALLKVKLFGKTGRKVFLTESGKILLTYAQKIFDLEREAERALNSTNNIQKETFHVGTTRTYARYLMPSYIREFHGLYPGVSISLSEGSSREMIKSLFQGKNELAIVATTDYPKILKSVIFREEELVLVASSDNPLCKKSPITVEELSRIPLIMREEGSGTRKIVTEMFKKRGFSPAILYEASNLECIKELLIMGEGLSFAARAVVEKELTQGLLEEIKIENVTLTMGVRIVYLSEKKISQAALSFLDILCRQISRESRISQ